jgi:1,4-alpha-glucan branching enzyme
LWSPYDAELFGHWWYEGPWFLDYLFRKSWFDQGTYEMTHLADYLRSQPHPAGVSPLPIELGLQGLPRILAE